MSERIDTSGSAFPSLAKDIRGVCVDGQPGLTKREWFAGMAMMGFCSTHSTTMVEAYEDDADYHHRDMAELDLSHADRMAESAYLMADAMLRAGKESQ